jgi:hypothetical protein
MVKCEACEKEFESERQLHGHLKAHDLRMASYYQKYFPRKDWYNGEIIKFKSKEYYFDNDFNSRGNMQRWLKSKPLTEAQEYCKSVIRKRIEKKKLKYTPSQVELRTIMSPPLQYYQVVLGDYYKTCKELGLKNKFSSIVGTSNFNPVIKKKIKIRTDSREQTPLSLDHPIEVKGLKFGDYTLDNPELCCHCYIERKSIRDFVGTFSGGFERFKKEAQRAEDSGAYLIVLIERKLNECMIFNKLPYVSRKVKVTPEFLFRNVRDLIQEFPEVQFLFVDGRREASRVTKKILFDTNCSSRDFDLQLAYDLKIL